MAAKAALFAGKSQRNFLPYSNEKQSISKCEANHLLFRPVFHDFVQAV
jgi:hypothetical protein